MAYKIDIKSVEGNPGMQQHGAYTFRTNELRERENEDGTSEQRKNS